MPPSRKRPRSPIRVGIVALPDVTGIALYGLYDLLRSVGRDSLPLLGRSSQAARFEPSIVSLTRDPMRAASGLPIVPETTFDEAGAFDIVCVPNLEIAPARVKTAVFPEAVAWLRTQFERGVTLTSVCSGSLLLAATGLLDGREATTHWVYVQAFRELFPSVQLKPERVLVMTGPHGRIVTSGGTASWHDLALFLVARYCGSEHATTTAKLFLLDWHADGQSPYAMMLDSTQHADAAVRRAQRFLTGGYREKNPVKDAIARSGLSERTFKRRFKAATGLTPIEYVQGIRIERAKELLERGDLAVEAVAAEVGYDDPAFFRRLFAREVGITPARYRRKFQWVYPEAR